MATKQEREEFERACEQHWAGRSSDAAFVRATTEKWRRTAAYVFAHWRRKLPAWVEQEDVEQELLVLALRHLRSWDPARGASIGRYVEWGAIHRAQRQINKWRGASIHGREGSNEGRAERAFSRVFADGSDPLARLGATEPDQEDAVEVSEAFGRLIGEASPRIAVALLALRATGGSAELASRLLAADPAALAEAGGGGLRGARKAVAEAVEALAGAAGGTRVPEAEDPPGDLWDFDDEEDDEEPEAGEERAA